MLRSIPPNGAPRIRMTRAKISMSRALQLGESDGPRTMVSLMRFSRLSIAMFIQNEIQMNLSPVS